MAKAKGDENGAARQTVTEPARTNAWRDHAESVSSSGAGIEV